MGIDYVIISKPSYIKFECPHCHEYVEAHRVCKNCGFYDGKEVIAQKEEKAN